MKEFVPEYYGGFRCMAGQCKHSCCIGWEIDIDDDTYEKYMAVKSPIKNKLNKSILSDGETHCFSLDDNERCPFLNKEGLCEIILELGEGYISQICRDHPRFRNFYGDRVEIGLGLCCEEAARLILFQERLPRLILTKDDGKASSLTEWEDELHSKREQIFRALQAENSDFLSCIEEISDTFSIKSSQKALAEYIPMFESLEILDASWETRLRLLFVLSEEKIKAAERKYSLILKQALHYFFYRHLIQAEDLAALRCRVAFCILSARMIAGLFALEEEKGEISPEDLIDCARIYSAEIEYSVDNTEEILTELSFLI